MHKDIEIDINHITRVEGHGRIIINVRDGNIKEIKLSIIEANRFFENFVKGMLAHELPWIISRICGICCVGHQLASTKAVENALGLTVSNQTILLRKLLNESQFLQSHVLHIFFLAAPDFAGVKSVLPLVNSMPDIVTLALRLKKLANDYTAAIGGRTLHPMANTLRGWRKLPELKTLEKLHKALTCAEPDIKEVIRFIKTIKIPQFERETEYISLKSSDEYALYDGHIFSSDTKSYTPVSDYRKVTNEFVVPHSTSKWSKWHRESYFVGALARINNK